MKVLVERKISEKPGKEGVYFVVIDGKKESLHFSLDNNWHGYKITCWFEEIELPTEDEIESAKHNPIRSTFQGTQCFAQERIAFDSGYRSGAQYVLDKLKGK